MSFSFSSNDDTFDWILADSTPTPNTGPEQAWSGTKASVVSVIPLSTHHDILSPQFIFAEASLKSPGQRARLVSPVYEAGLSAGPACLQVRVLMLGADVGSLSVGQTPETDYSEESILRTITGNYGEKWQEFLVDLTVTETSFQLFLEAVIGPSYLGDIAVDDIQLLTKEKCEKVKRLRHYT